jgi:hypothetical protein
VYEKYSAETMQQRAHVGSASWRWSSAVLGEFAHGSFADYAEVRYEEVIRNGAGQQRMNPALVTDRRRHPQQEDDHAQVPANQKLWNMYVAQAKARYHTWPSPTAAKWVRR